jgi:hypothetical protein
MDAAGGAVHRREQGGARPGEAPALRLRRAPVGGEGGGDPVESVIDTFLGAGGAIDVAAPRHADPLVGRAEAKPPPSPPSVRSLHLRCPGAASVRIGVETSGRVCLEVQVGGGFGVGRVLSELEEAERWLRSSAHDAAVVPVAARVDMSQPVRRRVLVGEGASAEAGVLARAGVEVGNRCGT